MKTIKFSNIWIDIHLIDVFDYDDFTDFFDFWLAGPAFFA